MSGNRQGVPGPDKKQEAHARLREGRLQEARDLFAEACRADAADAEAWFMQGTAAGQLDEIAAAEACFRRAAALQPERPEIHFNLGKVLETQGKQDPALESYRQALRLKPDGFAAHAQIASLLQAQGRLEEALASQQEAVRLAPEAAEAHYNLGNILRQMRRPDEAEAAYREALRLNSGLAEAWHNLGLALGEQGRRTEAVEAFREALTRKPELTGAYHNLCRVLTVLGRFEEAEQCLKAEFARDPGAASHCNMGNLRLRQQRLDEAIDHYRKALASDPHRTEAYNNLGNALRQLGRSQEAEAAYRQAVALNPEDAEAYANLGTMLVEDGQLEEALTSYRRALELDPGSRRAVAGEASVLEKQGDFEAAYERLRPLLEAQKADVNAALVFAALCRPLGRCEQAVDLLERIMASRGEALDLYDRIAVHFTLGGLLDGAGRYDQAFEHFRRGNELAGRTFDPRVHEKLIDSFIDTFTPRFMGRAARSTDASERPVFIVGMPRSGTTLVEQILASHPAVHGAGELKEIYDLVTKLPAMLKTRVPYPGCLEALTPEHCDRLAQGYLDHIDGLAPAHALRVTDKMPSNFLHLGLIALLFPQARIIHCVRDPLDTCLSCYFQHFVEGHPYAYDLQHLGFYYRQYRRLMSHWRSVLQIPILEVRYEELVADQETVSRAMVQFCGLPWDERCLRFHQTRRVVATASYDQVRQPLYSRSVARWRHYEAHLGPLQRGLTGTSREEDRGH